MYKNNNSNSDIIAVINMLTSNPDILKKVKGLIEVNNDNEKKVTSVHKSIKSKGKAKRPLNEEEYNEIIKNIYSGFEYEENGKTRHFRANERVGLALVIEATTGLRISDIVKLRVNSFKDGKIELHEKKTNKLQYRKINSNLVNLIYAYAYKHNLSNFDLLIGCTERNIQMYLKKAVDKLGYQNIGTHSFRKYFSMYVYKNTKDIQLLQHLLNHSSIATTQRYLGIDQDKLDEASSSVDFTDVIMNLSNK